MHQQQAQFTVQLTPPHGGPAVPVTVDATAHYVADDPGAAHPRLSQALEQATQQVLQDRLNQNLVALPTLSQSLAFFTDDITASTNSHRLLEHPHVAVTKLVLNATVPQSAVQPAAGQVMSGSEIAANVAGNFAQNAIAQNMPRPRVRANVGGFNVDVGPGASQSVGEQIGDEIGSRILHYVILGGVAIFVGLVCCIAVAVKLLF